MPASPDDRVHEVFFAVIELPESERVVALDRHCDGDPELRQQVTELVQWHEQADRFLETPPTLPTDLTLDRYPVGSEVGPFEILREVGRGGMGVVYEAEDRRLQRSVAIKVLPVDLFADDRRWSEFETEARLMASVEHPNIATVYSLEEDGDDRLLVLEFLRGPTLVEHCRNAVPSVDEALHVARQLASALEAAHAAGIVHRDLKPANVMFTADGRVKVLDFGIAIALGTGADTVAGTPGYMAPEQRVGGVVDARADLWAFGCILFELLTGERAFPHPTEAIGASAPTISPERTEVSDRVRRLIDSCLTEDVDRRIDSASAVRREVEAEIAWRAAPMRAPTLGDATVGNVHRPFGRLVGRDAELAELTRLLGKHRWATLTGVGGGGKTRLASALAWRDRSAYAHGAWFVELAGLEGADRVADSVLAAFDLRDRSEQSSQRVLVDHLATRRLLLVLDNCEHVLDGVRPLVIEILSRCPDVTLLLTSRERLDVADEVLYEVPPLPVPDEATSVEVLRAHASVELFADRAGSEFEIDKGNAATVAMICRRLDGIPLAIELAAARAQILGLEDLARRLERDSRVLAASGRSRPDRQRTIEATLDWSFDRLDDEERYLLMRLSVFRGSWTLEAAEAVCSSDTLPDWLVLDVVSRLISKSLVVREEVEVDGLARFRLLEPIRQYAHSRLARQGDLDAVERAYRGHFCAAAHAWSKKFLGPERVRTLDRFAADYDNLRAVVNACVATGELDEGLELAGNLGGYWLPRGRWSEGRSICEQLLAATDARHDARARAHVFKTAGNLAFWQGDYDRASELQTRGVAIFRELDSPRDVAGLTSNVGLIAWKQGDFERADRLYREGLAIRRELDDLPGVASSLNNLGTLAKNRERFEEARAYLTEAIEIRQSLGDRRGVAQSVSNLGGLEAVLGRLDEAKERFDEALAIDRELDERWGISAVLSSLGKWARLSDRLDESLAYHVESLTIRSELGDAPGIAEELDGLASVITAMERWEEGAFLFGLSETALAESPGQLPPAAIADRERTRAVLEERLGEAFARCHEEGRATDLAAGVARALDIADA